MEKLPDSSTYLHYSLEFLLSSHGRSIIDKHVEVHIFSICFTYLHHFNKLAVLFLFPLYLDYFLPYFQSFGHK